MKQGVLNIQAEDTGRSVELPEEVFGIEPNEHSVYLVVKHYLTNQRQGTHKAKERGEVAGSTKKLVVDFKVPPSEEGIDFIDVHLSLCRL